MADWAKLGHNVRRRAGLPSSHLESAGATMTRQHYTSDEAYELASQQSSSRIPMGDDAFMGAGQNDEFSPEQFEGTLMPRHNTQAMDPTNPGSKVNRANIERIGATYRVTAATTGLIDPTLGPTQAQARIVPSVHGRNTMDFQSAEESSYL